MGLFSSFYAPHHMSSVRQSPQKAVAKQAKITCLGTYPAQQTPS
jgi:hypothetical protein